MQVLFPNTRNTSRREEVGGHCRQGKWLGKAGRRESHHGSFRELQASSHSGNLEHMVVVVMVREDLGQELEW